MWDQFDVIILFRPSKDMFMIIDDFLKTWKMRNLFRPSLFLAMMLEPRKRLVYRYEIMESK